MELEATDRYEALGIKPNGCKGPCEGTGWVPVFMWEGVTQGTADMARPADEDDETLIALWREAETEKPTKDGWHFVPCPTCSPSTDTSPA